MPGIRRILPLAIGGILMAQNTHAAPKWDCRATEAGDWECFQGGVLVPPPKPVAQQPKPTQIKPEPVEIQSVPEPAPAVAMPLMERKDESTEKAADEPASEKTSPVVETKPTVVKRAEPAEAPVVKKEAEPAPETPSEPVISKQDAPQSAKPITTPRAQAKTTLPHKPDTTQAVSRLDQGLDWSQCHPAPLLAASPEAYSTDGDTHISADGADLYRAENRAHFSGNVELLSENQRILADEAEYDRSNNTFQAQGNVLYQHPNIRFSSSDLNYDLTSEQGSASDVEYRMLDRSARGHAERAQIDGEYRSSYTQVSYTTCRPGNEDWILKAAEMNIDKETGVGEAKHASVSFKGVPFFYLPYVTFPIDDRRKSGFLIPTIGSTENTGIDITTPYYFNIAPHMDATFSPRIMSKRGLMLGGEFRYLAKNFNGEVRAEVLPNDNERAAGQSDDRGAFSLQAQGNPAPRWGFDLDINHVSDDEYLEDFGASLAATSKRHQERRGDLRYQGDNWSVLARAQDYQTIDKSIAAADQPYSRLPQLLVTLNRPNQAYGLSYDLKAEYVQFHHDDDNQVRGERVNLKPSISLPMRRPWGFLTPKLSLDHTSYSLDSQTPGLSSSPNRTLPTFSLDGGLIFERNTNLFNTALTQTLEPRVFYLYTPKEDQSDIPDFDTTEYDFSFNNLFRENRFSGIDKIGDANQLTTALTSRFLHAESGQEYAQASIGQIFYFRDREVQLQSNSNTANDSSSAIVAALSANLTNNWHGQAGIQWNPHTGSGETEKSYAGIYYNDKSNRIFNATYRYTNGSIEQTDFSARWPVSHNIHLVGRWNYSILHGQTMEAFAGAEYSNCCWTTRFIARDYRSGTGQESNLGIFLQLELKGLTSIGDKIDRFLEKGILGYTVKD